MRRAEWWLLGLMLATSSDVRAQAVPRGGGTINVTSALVGEALSVASVVATTTDSQPFKCNSVNASCIDLGPGSCNGIGTDGSAAIILGVNADGVGCSPNVKIGGGGNIAISGSTITVLNGAINLGWKSVMVNTVTGYPAWINEENGLYLQPYSAASLPTCGAANGDGSATGSAVPEGTLRTVLAAGSSRTRLCVCTSDGAGTPAYSWRNLFDPGTSGTSTTCPATP